MIHKIANITQNSQSGILQVVKKDFFAIPISIRIISFSLFLFVFGRGLGADTFFSIYVKFIVDNIFWVSVIGALLSVSKLIFSIPIGKIADTSDTKSIIFLSKIFYVIAGFLYFFAGLFGSLTILLFAVVFTGFASSTLFVTYQSYVRKHSEKNNRCAVFGLFFSSLNVAYIIGGLISAILIKHIYLPYLFLFIVLFTLISLLTDNKLPNLTEEELEKLFGKETFLYNFFKRVFSLKAIKEAYISVIDYSIGLKKALVFELTFGFLNYIGFLFIPIISIAKNLSLSQIAIIFAVMRVPYIINFFAAKVADNYNKKVILTFILLFVSILFVLLGFTEKFITILIISFAISFGLSFMRPIISGLISDHTDDEHTGSISGVAEFVSKAGEISGALGFGILSLMVGIKASFVIIGVGFFVISVYYIVVKVFGIRK